MTAFFRRLPQPSMHLEVNDGYASFSSGDVINPLIISFLVLFTLASDHFEIMLHV
jgi:hypothetical protein